MDENIALESTSDKKFRKSVKGIHKLLTSGVIKPPPKEQELSKKNERKQSTRGLVYIGHIPHGFYEEQMRGYFGQFGKVTNAKVITSAKTGRSKGYGFVEFANAEVAQIVAETMNNYLMGKRLLKAQYIPPEKNTFQAWKRNWNTETAPGILNRIKIRQQFNNAANADNGLKQARNILKRLKKTKEILQSHGIDYNFFEPHDMPEELKTPELNKSKKITLNDAEDPPKNEIDKIEIKKTPKSKKLSRDLKERKQKKLQVKAKDSTKKAKLCKSPLSASANEEVLENGAVIQTAKRSKKPQSLGGVKKAAKSIAIGEKIKNTIKKVGSKRLIALDSIAKVNPKNISKKKKSKSNE